ncbi:MAG: hypothetical protein ABI608_06640 [Rhizomicrobium sp.]
MIDAGRSPKTGLRAKQNHDFERIRRLTIERRPKLYNLWFYMMALEAIFSIEGYAGPQHLALTGGGGFDQCPAPFAGPALPLTLQIVQATPDNPFPIPKLGSIS